MNLSLKILWLVMGIVILSVFIAIFLWDIPAPQTLIRKELSLGKKN